MIILTVELGWDSFTLTVKLGHITCKHDTGASIFISQNFLNLGVCMQKERSMFSSSLHKIFTFNELIYIHLLLLLDSHFPNLLAFTILMNI